MAAGGGPIHLLDATEWERVIRANLTGTFLVCKHALARMIEQGGKALAAYMKPREEGKYKGEMTEEVTDVVKTVGHVAEPR